MSGGGWQSGRGRPRGCRFCQTPIRWSGQAWKDETNNSKCEGQPNGHQPDNKLRPGQISKA